MSDFQEKFKENMGGLFKSQDSKYFIKTAFKVTLVPLISFSIIFYSLWNVLEMNYGFFVANGFAEGPVFKEAFIDKVFLNINEYFIYFGIIVTGVFMGGLFISHLALRPFEEIEDFCYEVQDDPDAEFEVNKINSKKIIYQGASSFFEYIRYLRSGEKVDGMELLPSSIANMKKPKTDKVFLMQYAAIVTVITLITNIVFYTFTNELYQEIVTAGVSLLNGNQVIAKFMQAQEDILFNIYAVAMALNVILYLGLSKNIIKAVDGVSYAFCRDFIQILQGNHQKRIFPRFTDPGKEAADSCNDYIEVVFAEIGEHDEIEIESEEEVDFNHAPQRMTVEPSENVVLFKSEDVKEEAPKRQEELPPSFIEEKQVSGSDIQSFNITTPKGYKVENLDEGQILKLLTELEKK